MSKFELKRKRIVVFGFEGKNNKTETNYFSHFEPKDSRYIFKFVSCGVTDPVNMLNSIKAKRKDYDYHASEDITLLFVDLDCDEAKKEKVKEIESKLNKDTLIIKSDPCFELWFLNHFCFSTKEYSSNKELINDLKKYIVDYQKNYDYFDLLEDKTETAVRNSKMQLANVDCKSKTDVPILFDTLIKKWLFILFCL